MKKFLLSALAFVLATLTNAQSNFITVWTSTTSITSIYFQTIGSANYTWTAMPSGNTGTGSFPFTFGGRSITVNSPANNTLTLVMSPQIERFKLFQSPNASDLIDITQWGSCPWSSMDFAFAGCVNLNVTATDVPNLSNVFNAERMFASCHKLTGPSNINSWNVSNITNLSAFFSNCLVFNQNVSNWNTSSATNMYGMFEYCFAFNQPISNWQTTNVTNMSSMFNNARVFNQSINSWNTSNVRNMSYMFSDALLFNQPLNLWSTNSVTNTAYMFNNADMFNQPIGSWNTSAVTDMGYMFNNADVFNQPLNTWNTSNVTNMDGVFYRALAFNQPLSNWDVSNVNSFNSMFYFFQNDPGAFNQDLGSWKLKSGASLNYIFGNCIDCNNYSSTLIGWSTNTLTPNGLSLSTENTLYGTNAVADRDNLIQSKNWTISGDAASGNNCTSVVTGINKSTNSTLVSIYPNPTTNLLHINSVSELGTIQIMNVLGKTVYSTNTTDNETILDLRNLNTGVYFIKVGNATKKIIKE